MAAAMRSHILSNFMKNTGIQYPCVRWASKKSSGNTKNKRKKTPGKFRSPKVYPGEYVHKDQILVTQLGLRYYPGQNVGLRRDWGLCALEDGYAMTSREKLNPYPDSPLYEPVQSGVVIEKIFWHVIPKKQIGKFKLVSQA